MTQTTSLSLATFYACGLELANVGLAYITISAPNLKRVPFASCVMEIS